MGSHSHLQIKTQANRVWHTIIQLRYAFRAVSDSANTMTTRKIASITLIRMRHHPSSRRQHFY